MIALKALQFLFFNAMDACCRLSFLHDKFFCLAAKTTIRLDSYISYGQYQSPPVCVQAKLLEPSFKLFIYLSFDPLFVTMAAFALRRRSPVAIFLVRPSRATLPSQNYSSNDTIFQLIEIIFSSPR